MTERDSEDIIHVKIRWDTFKQLKYRFKAYKKETAVHYFQRLAEYLKEIKNAQNR